MMRKVLLTSGWFLGLCLLANVAYATSGITCTPFTPKTLDKTIILPGVDDPHTTQIYFLQNTSKQSLWIDHVVEKNRSANAGWSSYIRPGKWSAILINRKNFILTCAAIEPGKVDYQNCAKAVSMCTPKITFNSKRKGSYWLVEDQSWDNLLSALEKRGVKLK